MTDPTQALRIPVLRRFLLGRLVSALGRQALSVAVGWELYERTNQPLALGLVGLVQVVPVVLLALPAGALVDRVDRRRVLIASQSVMAMCAGLLALASFVAAPVWVTYAILFFWGACVAFNAPASSSLVPRLVPAAALANANAWLSTAFQLAAISGPSAAGLLLVATGRAGWVYVITAAACLSFVVILSTLRVDASPAGGPRRGVTADELRAGLRFVFRTPLLVSALSLDLFAVLLGGVTALLPVFARDVLHAGPAELGWLRAAPALGALLMAVVQTRLPPWRRAGRVLLVTVAGFGVAILGFALSRSALLSAACLFATGAFDNVSVVIRSTLEQLVTPDALRGRVSAVHYVFIGLSNELGELESGIAAQLLGPVGAAVLGGAGTLLVVAVVAAGAPALRALGSLSSVRPPA